MLRRRASQTAKLISRELGKAASRRADGLVRRFQISILRRILRWQPSRTADKTFKDGLPFTPWAAELRKQRMAINSKDNPDAHCLPLGFIQLHTHSQSRKVVQTANDVGIMYEANGGLRNIFTDGRALPTNGPTPW